MLTKIQKQCHIIQNDRIVFFASGSRHWNNLSISCNSICLHTYYYHWFIGLCITHPIPPTQTNVGLNLQALAILTRIFEFLIGKATCIKYLLSTFLSPLAKVTAIFMATPVANSGLPRRSLVFFVNFPTTKTAWCSICRESWISMSLSLPSSFTKNVVGNLNGNAFGNYNISTSLFKLI